MVAGKVVWILRIIWIGNAWPSMSSGETPILRNMFGRSLRTLEILHRCPGSGHNFLAANSYLAASMLIRHFKLSRLSHPEKHAIISFVSTFCHQRIANPESNSNKGNSAYITPFGSVLTMIQSDQSVI